ncbi:hypothetical protein G7085_08580 [Tessaracoccus sp. HDW20]|uniref:hypothetical protein n=1 Tax=Tessaracoccus coleopterorum TaxID=2714950 RepID=UPI0018D44620|nr:hypothetical protein [Tessaracoccus coleopterorum]NHB84646.1 hypothetical protein [Tessaracoccus coleopterorum]
MHGQAGRDALRGGADISFLDSYGDTVSVPATAAIAYVLDVEKNRTVDVYDDLTNPGAKRTRLGSATWNADGTAVSFTYTLELKLAVGDVSEKYTNTAQIDDEGPEASVTVEVVSRPGLPSVGAIGETPLTGCCRWGVGRALGPGLGNAPQA